MSTRPLIKESLLILNVSGVHPYRQDSYSKIRFVFSESELIIICIEVFLRLLYHWNGLDSIEEIAVFLGLYQIMFKLTLLMVHRKILANVLKRMEKFWFIEDETRVATYKAVKKYGGIMLLILLSMLPIFYLKPFYSKNKRALPVETYHPVDRYNNRLYQLMYFFELTLLLAALPCITAFDMLFISFVINIIWELRKLKNKFSAVSSNSTQCLIEVYRLVDHHNLILGCIKSMDKIYHLSLLNTFVANMFCICIGLLGIISSGFPPNLQVLTKYGLYVVFYAAQLFFYCFTGSYLITECAEVSNSVYQTDWWSKTDGELRRSYVMIMQRANKLERLTAGGMLTLSLENFASIIKMALSFFTLVEASYNETIKEI